MVKSKDSLRNAKLLGLSSFFNDIGSNSISAILPFYIIALGGSGLAIGLISGLRDGISSLFNLLGGWLSDKIEKRKPFVFSGYFLSDVFKFLLLAASSWQQAVAFDAASRTGKFRDSPRDAILAQSKKGRGKKFGIQQALDSAGAVVGTALALLLFWKLGFRFKHIILISSSLALLSLITVSLVKERRNKKEQKAKQSHSPLQGKLKYFIFISSVFVFGNFGLYMFLLLRAKEITGNIITPLILFIFFNLTYAIFPVIFGKLSDKIGRKNVLIIGYSLFIAISLGLIFATGIFAVGVLFSIYGIVLAITDPNQRAMISDLSGENKGTAFGFYYLFTGIAAIAGGLLAGFLWDISYQTMFIFISAVSVMSIALLASFRTKKKLNTPNI